MLFTIVVHASPLSEEYSSFMFVTHNEVQVMLCGEPAAQDSPPLGAVTVTVANIENTALLWSFTVAFEVSLTLTRHCDVIMLGTVHE